MTGFAQLDSVAAVLIRDNIDTDTIVPSREIRGVGKTGLAAGLFSGWRYLSESGRVPNPQFVLNDSRYRNAQILLSGANFGCGSSREHAVWALAEYGIRAVVASSFNRIFFRNCVRNWILPAVLAASDIHWLADWVSTDPQQNRLRMRLDTCTITTADRCFQFDIDSESRSVLLSGLDEIARTLEFSGEIAAFRAADRLRRSWIYCLL